MINMHQKTLSSNQMFAVYSSPSSYHLGDLTVMGIINIQMSILQWHSSWLWLVFIDISYKSACSNTLRKCLLCWGLEVDTKTGWKKDVLIEWTLQSAQMVWEFSLCKINRSGECEVGNAKEMDRVLILPIAKKATNLRCSRRTSTCIL